MIGGSHRSNAELLAQGAANIASPLFGGLPATGAIARTATNVRAGGKTPIAGIVHSLTILLFTVTASRLTAYLAMPALAGLLIVTAWTMSEPTRWRERLSLRKSDRVLLFLTMFLTIASDLTVAIAVGTGVGLALRLLRRDVEPADWTPSDRSKL
jgi:SulP family sulfate permease